MTPTDMEVCDLRTHDGAHCLLLALRLGDTLAVRDDPPVVYIVAPDGTTGAEPVPLVILDAVEDAGWVVIGERGAELTERGRYQLERWGPRRWGRRAWERMRRDGYWAVVKKPAGSHAVGQPGG